MVDQALEKWLKDRSIIMEEDFSGSLTKYIEDYKKNWCNQLKGYLCPFRS